MKIRIKKPKIKIKAPKAVSKAISSATKAVGSVAKGDLKGAAQNVGQLAQAGKDLTKDIGSANLRNITGAVGSLGAATGLSPLRKLASNVNREGQSGINKYGDTAIDVAANAATGGTYGLAQSGLSALSQGGLQGLLSGKGLQDAALSAAGSYAGIDPNMLKTAKMGLSALQGDLKGSALQALGSYSGFDPKQLGLAETGLSALTGDKKALASGLASQLGAGENVSKMLGQFAGGKSGREVISDQAGAYAQDEVNAMLDRGVGGMNRAQVRELEKNIKQTGRSAQEQTQSAYKIAKGDTFNAIAKRMGVTPEQLRAANPQIKDINKIAAGASLNIPQETLDLSGEIRPGVVESGQMTQEEFDAARQEEPGFWDRAKEMAGNVVGGVKSAADKAAEFAAKNKKMLGYAAQGGAIALGAEAQEDAFLKQEELRKAQLAQEQAIGKELRGKQFDKNRYEQEQQFLQERIAGKGKTAETRQMEQESIQKAARTAAAGRLAGLEQQARLGGAALGTAGLAASLAGAQSGQNVMAEDMRARDVLAEKNLESSLARTGQLKTQQIQEEAELAAQKANVETGQAGLTQQTRGAMSAAEKARADALSGMYTAGADLVGKALGDLETPEEKEQPEQPQVQQPPVTRAPASTTPPARTAAARNLSMGVSTTQNTQTPQPKPIPPKDQFNQQNIPKPGEGRGYGVLAPVQQKVQQGVQQAQQTAQKAQSVVDEAKKKADEFKKFAQNPFGIK
jgi:LysM repeat protein